MKNLSRIQTPDDFEQEIFVRALLSRLETPELNPAFDTQVLRRISKSTPKAWGFISAVLAVVITGVMIWWISAPDIVRVASVPTISPYQINLEHLPPAPYHEYVVVERNPGKSAVKKRDHITPGVSGY
ncbi:MAG: hypothetical protein HYX66_04880 [Ignavibacteria bacterium]|nr:hypothetical protein [Ignavibacteria bacterium]